MRFLPTTLLILAITILTPLDAHPTDNAYQPPLIIWHGLGDSYTRAGLQDVISLAKSINPGTYVYAIHLADDGAGDARASFLGNVTEQLSSVCEQISSDPVLRSASAINALGFSQGGQFLRGYVERCNAPPVRNLVTFGSQHNGITRFEGCGAMDWVCRGAEGLLEAGKWSTLAQGHFVPAQYYRDPEDLGDYLRYSNFLADINNERERGRNAMYRVNMERLNRLAMYMFAEDSVVYPKESAWFAEVNGTSGEVTPVDERDLYKEDWLGLRALGESGRLEFLTAPGDHMQFADGVLEEAFRRYFGPVEQEHDLRQGLVRQVY